MGNRSGHRGLALPDQYSSGLYYCGLHAVGLFFVWPQEERREIIRHPLRIDVRKTGGRVTMYDCVFCTLLGTKIIVEDELVRAFYDKYPVSSGHVLIVPKRHAASLFEATQAELESVGKLLIKVKEHLEERFHPAGYNIGVNVGEVAGQTISHWHVHVIPRYQGDAGLVRWHA